MGPDSDVRDDVRPVVSDVTPDWEGDEDPNVQTRTFFIAARMPRAPATTQAAYKGAGVLVVDDEPAVHTIMQRLCDGVGYRVVHAYNGREALEMVCRERPDVIVTDVRMPEMDGIEFCRRLRQDPDTALLPVLMTSSLSATQEKVDGLDSGADEYLTKPFQRDEVLARLRAMLRVKFLQDQLEDAEHVIYSLARAVEAKDQYTAGHIERVSTFAIGIGRQLGLDAGALSQLFRGGVLHDIGKIGVPDSILNKPGSLTPREFDVIKRHTVVGDRICRGLKSLEPIRELIRHHHERLDGSGYPDGLSGDALSVPVRILTVCDVYDALTSTRSYRPAMPNEEAFKVLADGVASGYWDPTVVEALKAVVNQ
jgi:putative two-component system response regulator